MQGRGREEKRSHLRMGMDCPASGRLAGSGEALEIRVLDLSAQGVGMLLQQPLSPGSRLEIRIAPARALVPPLHALAEVVHVNACPDGYRAGARILELLE